MSPAHPAKVFSRIESHALKKTYAPLTSVVMARGGGGLGGYLSETLFGLALWVKEHQHEHQDPNVSTR